MKFATGSIVINPPVPVKQAGHLVQVDEISTVHDDLHARFLMLESDELLWCHISCDNLGVPLCVEQGIKKELSSIYDKRVEVVVSGTHSHHCADSSDERYLTFLYNALLKKAKEMKPQEVGKMEVSYKTCNFEGVGKSRISNHKANVILDLIELYVGTKKVVQILVHNVHPTILQAKQPFFSAEYPGYALAKLNEKQPECFHTFMQSCAGDVSTRFTRLNQEYESVEYLGEKLVEKVEELSEKKAEKWELCLSYKEMILPLEHAFEPIDLSLLPPNLTDREKETIGYGQIMREKLKEHPEDLKKESILSCVCLGKARILFVPNELFSWYLQVVDKSRTSLICYSHGYAPYVTGIGENMITYEMFTDTLTQRCKEKLVEAIRELDN